MKVESIAECSLGAFCNTFDLHLAIIGLETKMFGPLFEWPLKAGFTVGFSIRNQTNYDCSVQKTSFLIFRTRVAKILACHCRCTGSSEPSLLAIAISTKLPCAGSYI